MFYLDFIVKEIMNRAWFGWFVIHLFGYHNFQLFIYFIYLLADDALVQIICQDSLFRKRNKIFSKLK